MGLEGNKTPRFSFHSSALTITRYSNKTKKLAVTLASFCYSKSTHLAAYYTTIRLFFIAIIHYHVGRVIDLATISSSNILRKRIGRLFRQQKTGTKHLQRYCTASSYTRVLVPRIGVEPTTFSLGRSRSIH